MWNEPTKNQLKKCPKLYETVGTPLKEKIIHMHFFVGGSDWYIAEYDGDDTFFGYAVLNNDYRFAEWGYVAFSELKAAKVKGWLEVDNDLNWEPRRFSEIVFNP